MNYQVQTSGAEVSVRGNGPKVPPINPATEVPVEEDAVQVMKDKMARWSSANDRKKTLKAMKECSSLRSIVLDASVSYPESDEEWLKLEKEVCMASIDVNGISIGPGSHASSGTEVRRILTGLCAKLTESIPDMTRDQLYREIIVRLAESWSKIGTLSQLKALFGGHSLDVQMPHVKPELPKSEITIYESGQQIHATWNVYQAFGLYRDSDERGGKPWIRLTAAIRERSNLSSKKSVRTLEVRLPHK